MLYKLEKHEPLIEKKWNSEEVKEFIQFAIKDTEEAFTPESFWLLHPLDEDEDEEPDLLVSFYLGASSVIWTLNYLQSCGVGNLERDYRPWIRSIHEKYLEHPDLSKEAEPAYLAGETGLLLVENKIIPSQFVEDYLFEQIQKNATSPTFEVMWGSPGTMLVALFLHEQTKDQKWKTLFQESFDILWENWIYDEETGTHFWTQSLYGHKMNFLGPVHGFIGNTFVMLKGIDLIEDQEKKKIICERVATVIKKSALEEDGLVNWPSEITGRGANHFLVQWCHGAAGFVTSLHPHFPKDFDQEVERLLLAAGELIWKAGPLAKGASLCHGTAGNGYAFLKLYDRTQDPLWLDRAKAFAMHSIEQSKAQYKKYGRGRYSLWLGDVGVATYLQACLTGNSAFPSMDFF